ncbi:aromatic amino acid aminotransferase [Alteribacter lacisalsi]|uniref:Aminotransferase n=1 Tax=Alteribacter lacisalsi TaxID=2045244 RepID=A0A2W0H915_9BACI|nr:aminotransferase A [Alteribacter lacisalsi]PYZ98324.1 aromatic amino acid aminotransferase [Alteribacter lacisalsi]
MDHKLNPRVKHIQISGIRQFFNRVSDYPDAVQLTIGQPDFHTPAHIKEAAKAAIDENVTRYTKNPGEDGLTEAAAAFVKRKYGLHYSPLTEVITTTGASQAIDITMRTILEEGDEVILPGPVYPAYEPIIRLCGAVPVYADTRETGFKLTASQVKEAVTDRTKAVMIPYPSNPTGVVMNREELQGIADILKNRDIFAVSDEIYSELTYGGPHTSIASLPGMKEKTIVINGVSKSHSMTGWRIGFVFAPASVRQHILKVHQYNVSCASSISQRAALEALTAGADDAAPMRDEYVKRRDYMYIRLTKMGLPAEQPSGAFYMFPSIQASGMGSFEFCLQLLEETKLAVVPGNAFSSYGEGYIRLSFAYSMEILEEALDRLEIFWNKVRG